ncbi:MAG TPA: SUMF1/EgtB/PvdO family nonheme iron enzyme [Thermoanaerobaculia bacterium]|nr:SUMF1/EgtB/PvdO family nonheme iron enzyme [Thermoanaerobaculia bacterium]
MPAEFDVFLSYNSRDWPVVEQIGAQLKARGLRVWLDKWELLPGDLVQEALETAIIASRSVAVFVGPSGIGPWERVEMRAALMLAVEKRLRVVPVLLPGVSAAPELPLFLREFHWLDLRGGIEGGGLSRLVQGIKGERPSEPEPVFRDQTTRDLFLRRRELEAQLEQLQISGTDPTATRAELLDVRRQIRAGGQLRAGDDLAAKRYLLIAQVGRGGFATVWKAWDRKLRQFVAVKVLADDSEHGGQRRERFFRGARQMARLDHPGIVRVLEVELEDEGYHFFVMEYLPGGDLRQAVLKNKLTTEQALEAVLQAGEALDYAHRQGVIHRDIKPANILLDGEGRAKLTDFDLVRAFDTTGGTRTSTQLGTFVYAAPESMTEGKEAGIPADVYSLGMTTCFVVHGRELPASAVFNLASFREGLPCSAPLQQVLGRATALEAGERYGSVGEFLRALGEVRQLPKIEVFASPPRQVEPWPPPWSSSAGEDQYGRWAVFEVGKISQRMRWIPPGTFWMGSPESEAGRWADEGPRHEVTLTEGFWLGEVPCTQALWQAVMGKNPSRFKGADRPVETVSWEDCQRFLAKLNGLIPGLGARIPTEAEWERACRAGTEAATWVGDLEIRDNKAPQLEAVAWYGGNSSGEIKPVKGKQPNPWGLYDMLGNVWEWCADWQGAYSAEAQVNPTGPARGSSRVIRGGSWSLNARIVRAAARYWYSPDNRYGYLGFRLARGQEAAPGQPGGRSPQGGAASARR